MNLFGKTFAKYYLILGVLRKEIWTFCLSYWSLVRVKELTLFLLISLDCKLVPFDREWYESVVRYYLVTSLLLEQNTYILQRKIHKIKAQLQTQFCPAILKLNIDLSTVGKKKILTYIRVFTISQKIIDRGWGGGGGDFPDIPTNTERAAVPRLSSSFLLILPIVLSSGATEFNVNEEITNCQPIPPLSQQFAPSER